VTAPHLIWGSAAGVVRPPLRVQPEIDDAHAVSIQVEWLGHATVLIELNATRLLTDPVVCRRVGPLFRVAPPVDPAATTGVHAVLLSHLHADHAHPASLGLVPKCAQVLAPHGAGPWLRRHGVSNVRELRSGDEVVVRDVQVTAVPAAHDGHRYPWGPSGGPIGFVVRHSAAAYFAGDTDLFDDMAKLRGTLDLALLPVWGWGTTLGPGHLDPARAARAAAVLAPRVAIPIHWGTYALPPPFRGKAASDRPALEFRAAAAREAPGVDVRLLRPLQRTTVT
jgi:L-ascorbate metabolism protein UlaG (beta-lactamase superfamily)